MRRKILGKSLAAFLAVLMVFSCLTSIFAVVVSAKEGGYEYDVKVPVTHKNYYAANHYEAMTVYGTKATSVTGTDAAALGYLTAAYAFVVDKIDDAWKVTAVYNPGENKSNVTAKAEDSFVLVVYDTEIDGIDEIRIGATVGNVDAIDIENFGADISEGGYGTLTLRVEALANTYTVEFSETTKVKDWNNYASANNGAEIAQILNGKDDGAVVLDWAAEKDPEDKDACNTMTIKADFNEIKLFNGIEIVSILDRTFQFEAPVNVNVKVSVDGKNWYDADCNVNLGEEKGFDALIGSAEYMLDCADANYYVQYVTITMDFVSAYVCLNEIEFLTEFVGRDAAASDLEPDNAANVDEIGLDDGINAYTGKSMTEVNGYDYSVLNDAVVETIGEDDNVIVAEWDEDDGYYKVALNLDYNTKNDVSIVKALNNLDAAKDIVVISHGDDEIDSKYIIRNLVAGDEVHLLQTALDEFAFVIGALNAEQLKEVEIINGVNYNIAPIADIEFNASNNDYYCVARDIENEAIITKLSFREDLADETCTTVVYSDIFGGSMNAYVYTKDAKVCAYATDKDGELVDIKADIKQYSRYIADVTLTVDYETLKNAGVNTATTIVTINNTIGAEDTAVIDNLNNFIAPAGNKSAAFYYTHIADAEISTGLILDVAESAKVFKEGVQAYETGAWTYKFKTQNINKVILDSIYNYAADTQIGEATHVAITINGETKFYDLKTAAAYVDGKYTKGNGHYIINLDDVYKTNEITIKFYTEDGLYKYNDPFDVGTPTSISKIGVADIAVSFETGDIDGDGKTTSDDAIYLLRAVMNPEEYKLPEDVNADFNNDGLVNSDDAIYLLRHSLAPTTYPLYPVN